MIWTASRGAGHYDGESIITARIVLVPLVPAADPSAAGVKIENQFYANPADDSEPYFKNPDDFSGAPVFSLTNSSGRWLYNVIGVQSSCYGASGTLAICPFSTFAREIEDALNETAAEFEREAGAA